MLKEYSCRQVPGDYPRRFMSDDDFDLYVWFRQDGEFYGFQLCYDKTGREPSFTWLSDRGFSHFAVDTGDSYSTNGCAPVLVAEGCMPVQTVRRKFLRQSRELNEKIRKLIISKLDE